MAHVKVSRVRPQKEQSWKLQQASRYLGLTYGESVSPLQDAMGLRNSGQGDQGDPDGLLLPALSTCPKASSALVQSFPDIKALHTQTGFFRTVYRARKVSPPTKTAGLQGRQKKSIRFASCATNVRTSQKSVPLRWHIKSRYDIVKSVNFSLYCNALLVMLKRRLPFVQTPPPCS